MGRKHELTENEKKKKQRIHREGYKGKRRGDCRGGRGLSREAQQGIKSRKRGY